MYNIYKNKGRERIKMQTVIEKNKPYYFTIVTQETSNKVVKAINDFILKVIIIPTVVKIAYKAEGNIVTIWTFIKKPDNDILLKIHSLEQKIMEKFPDLILDFTVIFGNKELPEDFNEISINANS